MAHCLLMAIERAVDFQMINLNAINAYITKDVAALIDK